MPQSQAGDDPRAHSRDDGSADVRDTPALDPIGV
jgi:hypothetical protein